MKKEEITGLIVYLLILGLAVVFGLTVLQAYSNNRVIQEGTQWVNVCPSWLSGGTFFLFVGGAILSGVIFNAIWFEIAHVVGASIGGYKAVSVNILGFCFYKDEKKTKFKFASFDGLTGETKIVPKEGHTKLNPRPYLMLGTLFYTLEIIPIVFLYVLVMNQRGEGWKELVRTYSPLAYFFLTFGVVGGMIFVYNILPFHLDSMTDGYRLKLFSNPKNKEAFNKLIQVENDTDSDTNDVKEDDIKEVTNYTAELGLNKVNQHLEKHEYIEAESVLDHILENEDKIGNKEYIRVKAQKIFTVIMSKPLDEAKEYFEKEVPVAERREISHDATLSSIRTYILMAGLLDKSRSECVIALKNTIKAFKHTPKAKRAIEVKLYNEALDKVISAHPKWELEDYRFEEK